MNIKIKLIEYGGRAWWVLRVKGKKPKTCNQFEDVLDALRDEFGVVSLKEGEDQEPLEHSPWRY